MQEADVTARVVWAASSAVATTRAYRPCPLYSPERAHDAASPAFLAASFRRHKVSTDLLAGSTSDQGQRKPTNYSMNRSARST